MNKGAEKATGEYLYFLNADDRLSGPQLIENIVKVLEKGNADLLNGHIILNYPLYQAQRSFPFTDQMLSNVDFAQIGAESQKTAQKTNFNN